MNKREDKGIVPFKQDAEFFFRIGVKYVNKKTFSVALRYFDKAVKMEPFNPNYHFNRACVLAEMKQSKKSNESLMNILKNIDPTLTECYFGVGCNYFDMGNLKKAKEYFEKYIYYDPEGQFVDETYDILYYFQVYEDVGPGKSKNKLFSRLAKEGNELLKDGRFSEACIKLEKTIEIDLEAAAPRNDLSVALFCAGDEEKAISMAKSVLKIDPENMTANCNLLLFYASSKKYQEYEEQQKKVAGLEIDDKEQFIKLLDTYIKLEDHLNIIRIMVNYLKKNSEPTFYHLVVIAFFNLGQHENARDLWNSINECHPQYHLIVNYYSEINFKILNGTAQFEKLEYTTKLPDKLDIEYSEKLEEFMKLEESSLYELWREDSKVQDIFLFYLYEGSREIKKSIAEKLMKIEGSEVTILLGKMLNQTYVTEDIKDCIIKACGLEKITKTGKDSSKEKQERAPSLKIGHISWQKEWEWVIECALRNKENNYQPSYKNELKKIWMNFIARTGKDNLPVIEKNEAWAAALEYIYCNKHLIRVTKRNLAKKYRVSASSIANKLRDLNK